MQFHNYKVLFTGVVCRAEALSIARRIMIKTFPGQNVSTEDTQSHEHCKKG